MGPNSRRRPSTSGSGTIPSSTSTTRWETNRPPGSTRWPPGPRSRGGRPRTRRWSRGPSRAPRGWSSGSPPVATVEFVQFANTATCTAPEVSTRTSKDVRSIAVRTMEIAPASTRSTPTDAVATSNEVAVTFRYWDHERLYVSTASGSVTLRNAEPWIAPARAPRVADTADPWPVSPRRSLAFHRKRASPICQEFSLSTTVRLYQVLPSRRGIHGVTSTSTAGRARVPGAGVPFHS